MGMQQESTAEINFSNFRAFALILTGENNNNNQVNEHCNYCLVNSVLSFLSHILSFDLHDSPIKSLVLFQFSLYR